MDEKKTPNKLYDWRADMAKAASLREKSEDGKKKAGERLWRATKGGVQEWLGNDASDDSKGDAIYAEFLEAYGAKRQGDCSKMRAVALAVRDHGLHLNDYKTLSAAYAAASRASKEKESRKVEEEETVVAEKLTNLIAKTAPEKASTAEEAAKVLISAGIEKAADLLIETLGPDSIEAHRVLLRTLNRKITENVKPTKQAPEADDPKAEKPKAETPKAKAAEPKPKDDKPKAPKVSKPKVAKPVAAPK